jgi:site-specific recombinase XerD
MSRWYWTRLRDYLYWLGERRLLGFNPKHLRRQPRSLPPLACEFLRSLAPTHRRTTQNGYATALRSLYDWLDEHGLELRKLTHSKIASWFQELHAAGLAPVTRLGTLINVRVYLRWVHERLRMRTDPDDLVRPSDLPKLPLYLPRPLMTEADRELQTTA